ADHAGDQIDVDLIEADVAGPAVSAVDLLFEVGPAVEFEDRRLEVLDAEAEARHAHLAQRFELVPLQRAGFAFECHFPRSIPRPYRFEASHQVAELVRAKIRWRAPAEVDVIELAPAADRQLRAELDFLDQRVGVDFDIPGVLVGVHAEVAELAALATE